MFMFLIVCYKHYSGSCRNEVINKKAQLYHCIVIIITTNHCYASYHY